MKKTSLIALFTFALSSVFAQTNWNVDKSHSNIKFAVTHMVVSEVEGSFSDFQGNVESTTEDFNNAKVTFSAKAASVDTDNERRDGHLKSDDFFNAELYPELKFDGKITKEGAKYYLVGNFTIRDITKEVKFDVKYNGQIEGRRGKVAGFKVTGSINRFDYNLKWNSAIESGSLVVAEDVEIQCNIELGEVK